MEADQTEPQPLGQPNPPPPGGGIKKAAGPLVALGVVLAKFKTALIPLVKLLPFLKTGGSMILMIAVYTWRFGLWFAVGVVLLIFVHECGHMVFAKRLGLKVSTPMFIPFLGAFIQLKEMPRNAWIEALVGIGGPLFGAAGAVVCYAVYLYTGSIFFCALAYWGFLINLFNLTPIGFLDGGRIVTALSPWLWLVGTVIFAGLLFVSPNPVLILVLILSVPRLFSLFRRRSTEEARYFEVSPTQRWIIGVMYFGLIGFLVLGMMGASAGLPTKHPAHDARDKPVIQ